MKKITLFFYLFVLLIVLISCTTQKDYLYLQDTIDQINFIQSEIEVKSGDVLSIKVRTSDLEADKTFNISGDNQNASGSEAQFYLQGYLVSDSGTINMPLVGNISVQGFTVDEIENLIAQRLTSMIKQPFVSVRLLTYNITALGEVGNEGSYSIYRKNINIIEFLGLAGGITDLGNRHDVTVFRKSADSYQRYTIDLTSSTAFTSPVFSLVPGDIIIVKPLRTKIIKQNIPVISFGFATLSSVLLIINLFK